MPRYFFHRTDGHFDRDDEGLELVDIQTARTHAVVYAGESLRDEPELVFGHPMAVEVTDENSLILFTIDITTTDAFKPEPTL